MMLTLRKWYLIAGVILLITEILIALYIHDKIVRPYIGDFLVVIMLYCFIRAFINTHYLKVAIGVLLFAYFLEYLQYVNILKRLGLDSYKLLNVVLGNYFEWVDIIAYTAGISCVIICEKFNRTASVQPVKSAA